MNDTEYADELRRQIKALEIELENTEGELQEAEDEITDLEHQLAKVDQTPYRDWLVKAVERLNVLTGDFVTPNQRRLAIEEGKGL